MADHVNAALDRLNAMGKECISGSDGVPRFFYWSERDLYWTWRVTDGVYELDSEDLDRRTYLAIGRLHCGKVTEGYEGELERRVYEYIPLVETYMNRRGFDHYRQFLVSEAYPEPLDGMAPEGMRLTGSTVGIEQGGGVGGGATAASRMFIDFTFEVPFHFPLEE